MTRSSPHVWYTDKADEAAGSYASIFPDSRVDSVTGVAADNPCGPAGSVQVVEFTRCGQSVLAIGAGKHDPFNDAISLHVTREDPPPASSVCCAARGRQSSESLVSIIQHQRWGRPA